MKKIISLLLIFCIVSALFGCNNEPAETGTENNITDTIPEITDAETTAAVTAPDETTADTTETVTEPDVTTEEPGADTEPAPYIYYKSYYIYDPAMAGDDFSGSIMLFTNGRYSLVWYYRVNKTALYKVLLEYTEEGEYEIYEDVGELMLNPTELSYFIETDMNKKYKTEYLSEAEESYSLGGISKEAYDIIKKAIIEPYSATDVAEFKQAHVCKSVIACGGGKAVLDGSTAYFLIPGSETSDNEYYIAENGYMLSLHDDGTCGMSTNTERSGGDIGVILVHETYSGTYEKNGNDVRCIITKNTTRYEFLSEDDRSEFVEFYTVEYEKGRINKVYYNYYMALISEEGYVTDELSDVYLITTEPHTHTAFITGSPESEA